MNILNMIAADPNVDPKFARALRAVVEVEQERDHLAFLHAEVKRLSPMLVGHGIVLADEFYSFERAAEDLLYTDVDGLEWLLSAEDGSVYGGDMVYVGDQE